MVAIKNQNHRFSSPPALEIRHRIQNLHRLIVCALTGLFVVWMLVVFRLLLEPGSDTPAAQKSPSSLLLPTGLRIESTAEKHHIAHNKNTTVTTTTKTTATTTTTTTTTTRTATKDSSSATFSRGNNSDNNNQHQLECPSSRLSIAKDLTDEQRNPTVGRRWMVRPPTGGNLHLMCCDTTKGSFHVLLHERWAPIGVPHLLGMLRGGYFDTSIPLFRCTDACQFGLSSNATLTKLFRKSIPDDPLWLPTGPEHRFSNGTKKNKIKRYPKGVLTHAGGGKNTRSVQFVLTLKPNKFMGGGSPWEVPLGEVVEVVGKDKSGNNNSNNNNGNDPDDHGFVDVSLPDIYTGYGEKGPGQGLLGRKGVDASVRDQWPLLDYVLGCSLIDQFFDEDEDHPMET